MHWFRNWLKSWLRRGLTPAEVTRLAAQTAAAEMRRTVVYVAAARCSEGIPVATFADDSRNLAYYPHRDRMSHSFSNTALRDQ